MERTVRYTFRVSVCLRVSVCMGKLIYLKVATD